MLMQPCAACCTRVSCSNGSKLTEGCRRASNTSASLAVATFQEGTTAVFEKVDRTLDDAAAYNYVVVAFNNVETRVTLSVVA